MTEYSTESYRGFLIKIYYDKDATSPDDWDVLGRFYHWHSRYYISHKAENISSYEPDYIKELLDDLIYVPVYMYDHSGITISTSSFSCSWDSGQIGYYGITKDEVREEYGVKRISAKLRARVIEHLQGMVETWDKYYTGQVYGFAAVDKDEEDILDSCWGYYGEEGIEDAIAQAKHAIDYRCSLNYNPDPNQPHLFKEAV